MGVKIVYLRRGEKPPEGALIVSLSSRLDGKQSVPFESVGKLIARATEEGHGEVYVKFQPNS